MSKFLSSCPESAPSGRAEEILPGGHPCRHSWCRGFSLIEMVMALGISTFAIMSVVGAMSMGLNTLRSAQNQFLEACIIRKISADLKMTDFENIAGRSTLFDFYGFEVSSEADAGYRAIVSSPNQGVTAFPGSTSSISQNLAIVNIEIYRVLPGRDDTLTAAFPLAIARGR